MYDPSIYRVFKSKSDFQGSSYFEHYPGDFSGAVTCWNAGSIFIEEDGFEALLHLLRPIAGDFWYAQTRLSGRHLRLLLPSLDALATRIEKARSAAELREASDRISVDDGSFVLVRPAVFRMVAAVAGIADLGWRRQGCLWLLGL